MAPSSAATNSDNRKTDGKFTRPNETKMSRCEREGASQDDKHLSLRKASYYDRSQSTPSFG